MSVTINAKGTSAPFFTIGKNGTTFYRGSVDPSLFYTMRSGDYWFDDFNNTIWVWNSTSTAWQVPQLGNLLIDGSKISSTTGDVEFSPASNANPKIVFSGAVGPGVISAANLMDLYIDPTIDGGSSLFIMDNKWPAADGTANQVLTTDGAGILNFTTLNRIGSPAPATTATTGHAYIPLTTNTPTGVPTAISGYAPIIADSTTGKLWSYINNAWTSPAGGTTSTAGSFEGVFDGTVTGPVIGTKRKYIGTTVTLTKITAHIDAASITDTVITLNKNGTSAGTLTLLAGNTSGTTVIGVAIIADTDYITLDLTSGTVINLAVRIDYS